MKKNPCILFIVVTACAVFFSCTQPAGPQSVPKTTAYYQLLPYFENAEDSDYTLSTAIKIFDIEKIGVTTKIAVDMVPEYEGFVPDRVENTVVKEDGSSAIKVWYKRKTVKVYLYSTSQELVTGKYGQTFPQVTDPSGLKFWLRDDGIKGLPQTFPDRDLGVTAVLDDTLYKEYTVKHYKACDVSAPFQTVVYAGLKSSAAEKRYTNADSVEIADHSPMTKYDTKIGKEYPNAFPFNKSWENVEITNDSSPVEVVIVYDCNKYELTFANTGDTKIDPVLLKAGDPMPLVTDPVKTGFTFESWVDELGNKGLPSVVPSKDTVYAARWKSNGGTVVTYTVTHLLENADDDGFSVFKQEILEGIPGNMTYATPYQMSGFGYSEIPEPVEIKADGTTNVEIKYDRKWIGIHLYDCGDGLGDYVQLSQCYGKKFPQVTGLYKNGYILDKWNPELPERVPLTDTSYTAVWKRIGEGNKIVRGIEYSKTSDVLVLQYEDLLYLGYEELPDYNGKGAFAGLPTFEMKPYYLGQYEVTQGLFQAVMGYNPSCCNANDMEQNRKYPMLSDEKDASLRPVENVSLYEAVAFCNKLSIMYGLEQVYDPANTKNVDWLNLKKEDFSDTSTIPWADIVKLSDRTKNGYRLPSSYEWEYAAKGGNLYAPQWKYLYSSKTDSQFRQNFGHLSVYDEAIDDCGWYMYNLPGTTQKEKHIQVYDKGYGTHEVGRKQANVLDLYDMTGNVWEWTSSADIIGIDFEIRGGGWNTVARDCTMNNRKYPANANGNYSTGFRLARTYKAQ